VVDAYARCAQRAYEAQQAAAELSRAQRAAAPAAA